MKRSLRLLIILFTGLCLTQITFGAVQTKPPLFWPDNQLIPIQVSYSTAFSDGLEFTITEFNNSTLPIYTFSMRAWKVVPHLTYRKASLSFENKRNSEIKTGISLVSSQNWLKSLDDESLDRYVASLQNQYAGRFTLLNPETAYAPIPGNGFMLGKPYKLVHYRIEVEEKEDEKVAPVMDVWDFISDQDGTLMIFSFECPQSLASANSGTPTMLISSLGRMDEIE